MILIDSLVILLSWLVSYFVRFETIIPQAQQGLGLTFAKLGLVLLIITLYFLSKANLYVSQRFQSKFNEISNLLKAVALSFVAFVIFLYFFHPERISRMVLVQHFILCPILLTAERLLIRHFHHQKSYRILLVGDGAPLQEYINAAKALSKSGIEFCGWIDSDGMNSKYDINVISATPKEVIPMLNPDSVLVSYSWNKAPKMDELLKTLSTELTPIHILPEISSAHLGHQFSYFAGIPMISVNMPNQTTFGPYLKRTFDLMAAALGLIMISPLLIIIAIAVKLSSPGPIFYAQERMTLRGKRFKMWKFRSMRVDAENQSGAVWTVENDPRRTRIGTFLRATSLDELPQLWNVITGEMSLVGPRPERPVFVDQFKEQIPAYMLRHKMRAGITGWAQVNGWRGNTDLNARIECDIYYIRNWSLWLDIKILFMTVWSGFVNKNAY